MGNNILNSDEICGIYDMIFENNENQSRQSINTTLNLTNY